MPQPTATKERMLGRVNAWMAEHPWHPRIAPIMVYLLLLAVIDLATDRWPGAYPGLYVLQCGLVGWLLWRYRALTPELTVRFHWLAVPVGVAIAAAWVALGQWMVATFPDQFATHEPHLFQQMPPAARNLSLGLRLLGMSLLVPLFEELFTRSLLLRSFHRPRRVAIGMLQWVQDVPLLGDWLMHTSWGRRADRHERVFAGEFEQTPLGRLSVLGVTVSTLVFMVNHQMRDWPGTIVCGLAYCLLLAATARKGLGPVVWAHGITNALLWAYTLYSGDWQFL
jgi:membrane protease YdiL (CAAX protease family)